MTDIIIDIDIDIVLDRQGQTIIKIYIIIGIVIARTNREFILTLTLSLPRGHWRQKIIKVDRGLNRQSRLAGAVL